MERVKKGEKYYVLLMDKFGIYPLGHRDYRQQSDELLFEAGNYFYTKEEAEAMAHKLRAVLKGAEVIEMPSEEEVMESCKEIINMCNEEGFPVFNEDDFTAGWNHCYYNLKGKIVK